MKTFIAAAVLAASIALTAGAANAAPINQAARLPGRCLPHPQGAYEIGGQKCFYFYGTRHDISYRASDGDQIVLSWASDQLVRGYQFSDVPPFLRIVQTGSGMVLRGAPQPGDYTIAVYKDGQRAPTLDVNMRFIPL